MSHENAKNPLSAARPGFLDNETALVSIDGKYTLQISLPNKEVALEKKKLLDRDKNRFEEDYMFSPTYLLSSNYSISIKGSDIVIEGPLKELDAAIHRLHAYGYHISQQKRDKLLEEVTQIHIKEVSTRERQARQEKRNKKSEKKSSTKPAKDPNAFFPKTRAADTKTASIPSFTTPSKNPKIK